ncbi:hypothetical protein DSCO28_28440 [Desulfosarcina ovata subsp. sediminis]|uniref:Uncharacterized protein n=2 Tax=Desulfosarcina ovata TaxID=83564 RepID=A0A5K7ZJ59_9BACT|nr:hypothetical protein DSCO28_28440 [Desulfosarcina ovata subsp. sediminis]
MTGASTPTSMTDASVISIRCEDHPFHNSLFYFIELNNSIDVGTLIRQMTAFILGGLRKNGGRALP